MGDRPSTRRKQARQVFRLTLAAWATWSRGEPFPVVGLEKGQHLLGPDLVRPLGGGEGPPGSSSWCSAMAIQIWHMWVWMASS